MSGQMTWILEGDAFQDRDCLEQAAKAAGHQVVKWDDEWWSTNAWPKLDQPCVFHGSLGNADRIRRELPWRPGSYCNTEAFLCSSWYPQAKEFLLHEQWEVMSAARLVETATSIFDRIGDGSVIFVRPDSPLKPFSGRVVKRGRLTLEALDHGFYYDDVEIPVVVTPVRRIEQEWRFVVVEREVVAGSGYIADGRTAIPDLEKGKPWLFAEEIAQRLASPDAVYVMDVCESDRGLRLLELNPFSGADLYACDGDQIVRRVAEIVQRSN